MYLYARNELLLLYYRQRDIETDLGEKITRAAFITDKCDNLHIYMNMMLSVDWCSCVIFRRRWNSVADSNFECVSGIYSIELVNDNLYEWNIKLYK